MSKGSLGKLGLKKRSLIALVEHPIPDHGIGRRAFLISAAATLAAQSTVGRAASVMMRPAFRARKNAKGKVETVSVSGSKGSKWTIDTRSFEGSPELTATQSDQGAVVSLKGAVLPGTSFVINLVATITTGLLSRRITLAFTDTGVQPVSFTIEADLDKWIAGSDEASVSLSHAELHCLLNGAPLAAQTRLTPSGSGVLVYQPDGTFEVTCNAALETPKLSAPLTAFSFGPGNRDKPSILTGDRQRFTRLSGTTHDSLVHELTAKTASGWHVDGHRHGVADLTTEIHKDGTCATLISGGTAAFMARAHDQVDLCLNNAHTVVVSDCNGTSQGVVANLHDRGNWVDFPGFGVELGPTPDRDSFLLMEGEDESYADVELSARRYALHLEDAIVTTQDTAPMLVSLALGQTRRQDPPIRIKRDPIKVKEPPLNLIKIQPSRMIGSFNLPTRIDVVRREDMLSLSFEFVNMRLETDGGKVVRSNANKPAYMIVTFPPQSIAEKTYREDDTGGPMPSDLPPVPSRVSGHSRLVFFIPTTIPYILFSLKGEDGKGSKGLLDWDRLTPNVVRTAFSSYATGSLIKLDSRFQNPADFVRITPGSLKAPVEKKDEIVVPPTRTRIRTNVSNNQRRGQTETKPPIVATQRSFAAIDDSLPNIGRLVNPAHIAIDIPHERIPVIGNPLYTAIELPVRLILSPNESQVWAHAADLVQSPTTKRVELWHTRLARRDRDKIIEGGKLPIRAVDAVDYDKNRGELFGPGDFDQAMMRENRVDLVNNMVYRSDREDSKPFYADRLMLTPLGGYLKGSGNWEWCYIPEKKLSHLMSWTHNSTLGRDHYVKIVTRGYLFPTGHPAAKVEVSERKIAMTSAGPVAYLRKRMFVLVRQDTMTFNEDEQRQLGLKSIKLLTKETPPLSPDSDAPAPSGKVFWTLISSGPFPMSVQAEDVDGHTISWGMPMIFVDQVFAQDAEFIKNKLIPYYNAAAATGDDAKHPRRHRLFGQKVSLAPAGDNSESTAYPTEEIFLTAIATATPSKSTDRGAYRCILKNVKVRVAAADYLAGSAAPGPIEVEIPDVYKTGGFNNSNTAKIFLKLTDNMPKDGVPLKFGDASKSGGLVNPDSLITAFARGRGPIGGKLDEIQTGMASAKDFLPDTGKILGAVSLWELLPDKIPITPGNPNDPNSLKSPRMELKIEKDSNQKPIKAIVQFRWNPEVNSWPADNPILKINRKWSTSYAPLELRGDVTTDLVKPDNSSYEFVGVLKDFDIDCIAPASFILLHFDELRFTSKSGEGSSVSISPAFPKTTFVGPLTFVQKLQDLISSVTGSSEIVEANSAGSSRLSGFEFTPFMDITPQAIRTGFHIGIPNLAFGAFTIENIALLAELNLPLIGSAMRVRFAFCERSSPFRLSVMGFAGGGFLAIVIGPEAVEMLEASLEFGGSLALDIGVASGGVSVMAGIYFKMEGDNAKLEGYVRLNGRLSVLGIIRVSIEFYLSLAYDTATGCAYGTARVTVEVEVLFFSASVSMTVQRQFKGGGSANMLEASNEGAFADAESASFTKSMSEYDWTSRYCVAFA